MVLRLLVLLIFAFPVTPLRASSFTLDDFLLNVGAGELPPNNDDQFFLSISNPFMDSHSANFAESHSNAIYDFFWGDDSGILRIDAGFIAAVANDMTSDATIGGRITITVTEPISILVDAELNFDLPMDQMRAGMSVGFISLDGAPIGGGQSFNYNTIFGTGPNIFVYEDHFDLPPGQYLLAYSMDIDATPSSAGAVGTANGFVEFRIVPEPAIAVPVLLFFILIMRPARMRSLTKSCQATAKKCSKR